MALAQGGEARRGKRGDRVGQDGHGEEIAHHLALWGLTPVGPVRRTSTAWLAPVRRGSERLMLKGVGTSDEAGQGAALAHWAGRGAVRLLAQHGEVLLLERAAPGGPLSSLVYAGRDDEATAITAEVIATLHAAPTPEGFVTVEDWGRGFERVRPRARAGGADVRLIDRAADLYRDLCASQGAAKLLHGDLHHDNILHDEGRGWLAIDPKGVVGEAAFETGAMLRNPGPDPALWADRARIARRTAILCERLDLDLVRVVGWCFARAVLSALWHVEDRQDPGPAWSMARATLSLL